MTALRRHRDAWPLGLVLAYAVTGVAWAVVRTPLGPGEAALLLAARDGGASACAPGARGVLEILGCGLPGVAGLVPGLAALGERLGGLFGARALLALAAPALVLLVVRVGAAPSWGGRGLLAAATFVALGPPLQLLATVHPRALAAVLVGLAAALAEPAAAEQVRASWARPPLRPSGSGSGAHQADPVLLALAGAALALAVTATPVAALVALPLAAVLALRGSRAGAASLAAGAVVALSLSAALADRGAWDGLGEALRASPPGGWSAAWQRVAGLGSGLAMPALLAGFALFHRDGGGRAALALAVAAPAAAVPALSVSLEDARTGQLLAFTVLAPAAAVGVACMSETFASGNPSRLARPFFAGAILVVAGVHGIHEMRTLRRDGPDLSSAAAYLRRAGGDGQTLLVESDFGSPERVYRYLGAAARVVPVARASATERQEALRAANPEWVVLDAHHADRSFATAEQEYLAHGFAVAARWDVPVGAGARRLEVLRREAR